MNKALFSSERPDWETPRDLFSRLDAEFHFALDVCATAENAKCAQYYTPEIDGLRMTWPAVSCWCNPPYGRQIAAWIRKAYESAQNGSSVVLLIPARTDTRWFHDLVLPHAEMRFLKGRLTFVGAPHPAPFPSMLAIYRR